MLTSELCQLKSRTLRPQSHSPSAAPAVGASAPSPIDYAYLARYTLGDKALEREVLRLFVDQLPALLDDLSAMTNDPEWADTAHAMKGSAMAVGAHGLAELAQRAESCPVEDRPGLLPALADTIAEVTAHIDARHT